MIRSSLSKVILKGYCRPSVACNEKFKKARKFMRVDDNHPINWVGLDKVRRPWSNCQALKNSLSLTLPPTLNFWNFEP